MLALRCHAWRLLSGLHDEVATHRVLDNVHDSQVAFDAGLHLRPALAVGGDDRAIAARLP